MFACLYGHSPRLVELADQFSPLVERIDDDTVVFSIAGLGRLFGDLHQIASEIARCGTEMGVTANLATAANPSTAVLAARNLAGTTVIALGHEPEVLASIPVEALPAAPELVQTLERWGIRTLGDLAALPEIGLVERLGESGCRLRRLALGQGTDLLDVRAPATEYTMRQELDHPVELLESLLFILSAQLHGLMDQLQQNGRAAGSVTVTLGLGGGGEFKRALELPFPLRDPRALLKQVQLSLEANPPQASVVLVQTTLHAVDPRVLQGGLFLPAAPEPEKLQTLLARLRALAGEDRVGSPQILDTHRPDAHRLRACAFETSGPSRVAPHSLRLALRYFRPPITARVNVQNGLLRHIASERVAGAVTHAAGPWRTSGEWWTDTAWKRDEWDVVLENRAIYRLYLTGSQWFLDGSYD